jgi:chorismate mutase/prephenate dehydratase
MWDYIFYIDIDGHVTDDNLAAALDELQTSARQVKVLGTYPRAVVARHTHPVTESGAS